MKSFLIKSFKLFGTSFTVFWIFILSVFSYLIAQMIPVVQRTLPVASVLVLVYFGLDKSGLLEVILTYLKAN